MKNRRLAGIFLVGAASLGIVLSLFSLIGIWLIRPGLTDTVTQNLDLVNHALVSSEQILIRVDEVVQATTVDVSSVQAMTTVLSQAIHDTNPMIDSMIQLTSTDLPTSLKATQTSLTSAQSSALLIDNILTALTSLPLSPFTPYKPAVPLHTSLEEVSKSLDTLIPSLETINTSVETGKTNMAVVDAELAKITETTKGITDSLTTAQADISVYRADITQLRENMDAARQSAPEFLMKATWFITLLALWLLLTQVGLGILGIEMLRTEAIIIDEPDLLPPSELTPRDGEG